MQKVDVDYLKFRTQSEALTVFNAIKIAFFDPSGMELHGEEPGKDGWKSRRRITLHTIPIACMDFGGDSQRGWLRFEMTGKGCGWVESWDALVGAARGLAEAELMRVDLKLDTRDGSVSHGSVLQAYADGLFKKPYAGRNPSMKKIETADCMEGQTVYIGSRSSARYIRCYEKGLELLGKLKFKRADEFIKVPSLVMDFDDGYGPTKVRDFYRVEVELKAVDKVVLPWPALIDRDAYFAGTAPYCQQLVDAAPRLIRSIPSDFDEKATLYSSIQNCKIAYGGMFKALLSLYGDSPEAKAQILDFVLGDSVSKRLKESGVLLLDVGG